MKLKREHALFLTALFTGAALWAAGAKAPAAGRPDPAAYRKEIETWRQERLTSLKKEDGWLSLVGL